MAATDSSLSSGNPAKKEDEFNEFYTEVRDFPLISVSLYMQRYRQNNTRFFVSVTTVVNIFGVATSTNVTLE